VGNERISMEGDGKPRHRSQNPRGEGESAGSDRIKAFGVEIFAIRFVSTSDFALFPCSITIDSNFSRPYSFPQNCWMQAI
jgi:hypothetical protein